MTFSAKKQQLGHSIAITEYSNVCLNWNNYFLSIRFSRCSCEGAFSSVVSNGMCSGEAAPPHFFHVGKLHVTLSGFFFLTTREEIICFQISLPAENNVFFVLGSLGFVIKLWTLTSWPSDFISELLCICKLCLWHLFQQFESTENPKYPCRQG